MKISISVNGRFHGFDLAAALYKAGHLDRLITSYPAFKAEEWGIPPAKVVSILPLEILNRTIRQFPHGIKAELQVWQHCLYDRFASYFIPRHTDVFIGWSGSSLQSIKVAKAAGALTVLERGSSHILTQQHILEQEHKTLNLPYHGVDNKIIRRELEEYQLADYIALPSEFTEKSFLEQGVLPSKLLLNNYGCNLAHFYPKEKTETRFRVIFVGDFCVRKGSHYLIEAAKALQDQPIDFWHVGAVSTDLQSLIKTQGAGNFIFHGVVDQKKLVEFYTRSDVFVIPSLEEGLAMVIIQAMASGLPVIGTFNSGCTDVMEDGVEGLLIPVRSTDAIVKAIKKLHDNPDLTKLMGGRARAKVESQYRWEDYGLRAIENYRKILEKEREPL